MTKEGVEAKIAHLKQRILDAVTEITHSAEMLKKTVECNANDAFGVLARTAEIRTKADNLLYYAGQLEALVSLPYKLDGSLDIEEETEIPFK